MEHDIRVLHVDDQPDFADMAAQFLSRQNDRFSIETALDADEALDTLQHHSVDCVVSDYDMPGTNGIELLDDVRESVPDLPFILFTGKGSEEIASEAISAGVTDYLQKEPGPDQYVILANRIENAVERVRAEHRANESHALYKSLTEDALDTSKDGTIILDSNFEVVWINSAIETYFDLDRNEVIGEDKRELIDSHIAAIFESPEEYAESVTATFDDNTYVEEFECHVLPAESREERWLRHWSQPIEAGRFAGGRIEHYTDITEFKEREQEITRLNELHETVLANIRDAVFLTDDEGQFTYICPNVEFIFGYDREAVADIGTIQALLGERLVESEELAERYAIHNIETTVENQAGEPRQLLVTVSAVDIDGGSQLYSIRDVSNRSDREQAYRELSRRHELALEATDTGVWEWNMETDEVVWTEALERLLGLEPGEFGGTFDAYAEFLHPDAIETVEHAIERAHGGGMFDEEFRMIRDDGEVIWVHGQGRIYTEDGPNRMLGITTDVTERKEDEQRLQRQKNRLEKFARIVSHDLRNPLTVAQGRLELVRQEQESDDLDAIARAHERMNVLIEDLLTLARDGEATQDVEQLDLDLLAEECWQMVDQADARFEAVSGLRLEADRSRLKQLIENLVRNAIEHGGAGVSISLGALESGFYVEDDGPGIPESIRDDVLSPGFTTSEEGSGYGLSIVEEVVEAHGWSVAVTDGSDGGARFEITGIESAQ